MSAQPSAHAGRARALAALELVQLGGDLRAREGAHLLPRVGVRRARRGARRSRRLSRARCARREHHPRAATARASCAPSTTCAAIAVHACAAMPAATGAPLGGGTGRHTHHLPLSSVDLRSGRTPDRSAAPERQPPASTRVSSASTRWALSAAGGFVFLNLTPAQAPALAAQLGGHFRPHSPLRARRAAHRSHAAL